MNDPHLIRLFDQPPAFSDGEAFAAGVEGRLRRAASLRTWTLAVAACAGGAIGLNALIALIAQTQSLLQGWQGFSADPSALWAAVAVALAAAAGLFALQDA